ncbi:hypothetical protein T459_26039 [Capsicum annuum]|uniref:Ty3 transposon capsid-like protein domain-containing protein n=1 Tax=Capsicum annuum TaxID=4072 RepID=A0A2G2YMK8_CAPAN|nr:hypothetical protein T459_26039 [Capsicum annuum]
MGILTGEVTTLKKLDQVVLELKEYLINFAENRREKLPAGQGWNEYVIALVERFGSDFDNPMEELKIKQVGTVNEYQAVFERHLTRVNLSEENTISCYIGGLSPELNIAVKITNPTSLSQVYKSARLHEAYLDAIKPLVSSHSVLSSRKIGDWKNFSNKPILPTPNSTQGICNKNLNRRRLSLEEINEKREKRLCYFCNEKYTMGHNCKTSKQLNLLELEEVDETDNVLNKTELEVHEEEESKLELSEPAEHMEISIHALNGSLGFRTLKVTGYHAKKGLYILIDTGSSHNFIDPDLVQRLGCAVRSTSPQMVAAANGSMKVD